MPVVKTPFKPSGLGYQHLNGLNKPKPIIPGPAIYKYWFLLIFSFIYLQMEISLEPQSAQIENYLWDSINLK